MLGCSAIPLMPHTPMTTNQMIITGPNILPTLAVPRRCTGKRAMMIAAVIGTTRSLKDGVDDLEALDRRQHRDGRRDHAVAEEQRRAEDPQRREHGRVRRRPAGTTGGSA